MRVSYVSTMLCLALACLLCGGSAFAGAVVPGIPEDNRLVQSLWQDGELLDQLTALGVTQGADGYPLYDGRPLRGVVYSGWEGGEMSTTFSPFCGHLQRDTSPLTSDAIYLRADFSGSDVVGVTPISVETFLPHSPLARSWQMEAVLAPFAEAGVTADAAFYPEYSGMPVWGTYLEPGMLYRRYTRFDDAGQPLPEPENAVYLSLTDGSPARMDRDVFEQGIARAIEATLSIINQYGQ